MKKIIEITAVLIAMFLLFLIVASAVLHVFLPPEKAKALVLKQLTARLKREVQVGSVSVGLLSGLNAGDLKVSESPDFSHGTFISSEQFSIRLAILPLLFRKVVVKQLVLRHPIIHIVRYPDGKTFNFSDLITPTNAPSPSPPPPGARVSLNNSLSPTGERVQGEGKGLFELPVAYAAANQPIEPGHTEGPPFYLVISNAQVQHGVMHFEDRSPAKQSVDVDPLDLKLRNVSLTSPFRAQASMRAKSKGIEAALQLAGEADLRTASFKIKTCTFSSGGSTVILTGQASGLKGGRPNVDLQLAVKEFKLGTVAPFVRLPPGFTFAGPIVAKARVKGDQQRMDFSAMADLAKVKVVIADKFYKPANVPMGVSLQGRLTGLKDAEFQRLQAVLGPLQLSGHGRVEDVTGKLPQVEFHLETNSFPARELADYIPLTLPKELRLKGSAQLAADVSGTQISSRITAKCDGRDLVVAWGDKFAKPAGMPMRLAFDGELLRIPSRSTFNFQSLNAALGSIALAGKGSLETSASEPKFQLVLASNAWPLHELEVMAPLLAPYHASGTATVNVRASGLPSAPVVNGALGLQDVSIHYQRSELSQISAAIGFTQQDVSIPSLTGKLDGNDLRLKLAGHRLTSLPDVTVEANLALLDLDKLLPPQAAAASAPSGLGAGFALALELAPTAWAAPAPLPPMKLSGHLTVGRVKQEFYDARSLDIKWNLSDVTPDLSSVNGNATLRQGPGKLTHVDKLAALSKTAKVALLPITTLQKIDRGGLLKNLGLPSLQTIPFDGIRGDYLFQSGVMTIKTFELAGHDVNVNTLGTIGLAGEQPMSLRVALKLASGSVGGTIGELVADESGRPTLNFTAQGTAANPRVRLDVREAGKKAVQKVGEQLLKGFGLGGNASSASPSNETGSSQAPSQSQPENPVEDLQKALKNIFH